jgi:putative acetyltransferase
MENYSIKPYLENYRQQIIAVWEQSVLATHHFLAAEDIDYFKTIVSGIDFSAFNVFCLMEEDAVKGFIGVADSKIEMLFLQPEAAGKGFGKMLVNFAVQQLQANMVDVNEQNDNAVGFYEKFGFVTYERTPRDSMGKDYPILKMKLNPSSKN